MKRISILVLALACMTGCYDEFVMDFDYSTAYLTYQYDMRTMVVGEGAKFDVTASLGGVIQNDRQRDVKMSIDDELVTADLSQFSTDPAVASFTALDVFKGATPGVGELYHADVQRTFNTFKVKSISPLPSDFYTVSGLDGLAFEPGRHTTSFTISATGKMIEESSCIKPAYAIGVRLVDADVDSVLTGRNFAVIATRLENKFYGNWYYGGSYVVKDASGKVTREEHYQFSIPQADDLIYSLTTVTANSVMTDKYLQNKGSLLLTFNGNDITITSESIALVDDGRKSYFNDSKLLQERELHLNYTFKSAGGSTTEVSDVLYFRNRVRDGANEWQDENPEHYK